MQQHTGSAFSFFGGKETAPVGPPFFPFFLLGHLLGLLLVMRMWHLPLGAKLGGEPHINGSPGPRGCLLGSCSILPSHVVELQLCFFRLGVQLFLMSRGFPF